MNHFLKAGSHFNLLFGMSATIWFMFQNGDPNRFSWYLLAIPFLIWSILPFATLFIMMKKADPAIHNNIIIFITSSIISFGGAWILYDAFVTHLDPQSGLVFLFLPILQIICISAAYVIMMLLNRLFTPIGH